MASASVVVIVPSAVDPLPARGEKSPRHTANSAQRSRYFRHLVVVLGVGHHT
ncbi:MAG: hypothetical protein WA618_09925 [Terriglobales bacterium]